MVFRVHVRSDIRPESNTALVLLSGGPGTSSALWKPLDRLAEIFPVVTVDFPGTAGLPEAGPYTFAMLVEGLERELTALPFERFVVAGFSFGGLWAAALACRGRLAVAGWLGIASPLSPGAFALSEANFRPSLTEPMRAAEAALLAEPTNEHFVDLLIALCPNYFLPENQEAGRQFVSQEKPSARLFLEIYGEMMAGKIPNFVPQLKKMTMPKVFIAGMLDGMIPDAALKIDAANADAYFVTLPSSHFVNFEVPEAVAAVVHEMSRSFQ